MVTNGDSPGRLHKQRRGACDRCGWTGPVSKVGRGDRKHLDIDKQYGRLCAQCAIILVRRNHAPSDQLGRGHVRLVADRSPGDA